MATFLFTFFAGSFAHAQNIRSGEDLLRAMHDRYKSSWYETVTFTQKSTTYKEDGTSSAETWYEAASVPGKLRIDIGPAANGNGYIFSDGNITIIKDNKTPGDSSRREYAARTWIRRLPAGSGNDRECGQGRGLRSFQIA